MNIARRSLAAALLSTLIATAHVSAQRTRTVEDPAESKEAATETAEASSKSKAPAPAPLPKIVKAKYMGGFLGYNKKQEGTLNFDDRNQRLVFRDKNEKEIISLSYDAVVVAFADSKANRWLGPGASEAARVGGIVTLPLFLFKKRSEYLSIQFRDPDTDAEGVTSFKMDTDELANSMVYALAQKAGLVQRGEIYVRTKKKAEADPAAADNKPAPPE
ncbi:MAG TPA: hypothetical protein VFX96_07055 [Pyrinomonadaceae bacterium]|nr:hypothetical protein [Pyrinomonadaceae bacterium]